MSLDSQAFTFGKPRARSLSDGRGSDPNVTRVRVPSDDGKAGQAMLFRKQMERLAELERTPVYQEMCAAAGVARAALEGAANTGRTHGLIGTYANGCRCDECRRASSEKYRNRKVGA